LVNSEFACPAAIPYSNNSTSNLHTIFNWCVEDNRCSEIYHQSYRRNFTVFRYLIDRGLSNDLYSPIRALLCDGKNLEEFTREIWLLNIKANPGQSYLQCDVNHFLSVDINGIKSSCACRPDRTCSDNIYDLVPFYILIALIGVLGALYFFGNLYRNYKLLQFIKRATGNDRMSLIALDQVLK